MVAFDGGARIEVIKKVGDIRIKPNHKASCNCESIALIVQMPDGIVDPRRCDCTICRRKGAIVASIPLTAINIVKGNYY